MRNAAGPDARLQRTPDLDGAGFVGDVRADHFDQFGRAKTDPRTDALQHGALLGGARSRPWAGQTNNCPSIPWSPGRGGTGSFVLRPDGHSIFQLKDEHEIGSLTGESG
jgi:hypothetical protein